MTNREIFLAYFPYDCHFKGWEEKVFEFVDDLSFNDNDLICSYFVLNGATQLVLKDNSDELRKRLERIIEELSKKLINYKNKRNKNEIQRLKN